MLTAPGTLAVRRAPWLAMVAFCAAVAVRAVAVEPHIALVPERPSMPAGEPFEVAVVLRPPPGWHTYWLNPGESGMAPQLTWQLPDGLALTKVGYPLPTLFTADGMTTIGYEAETALIASFVTTADVRANTTMPITLRLSWLICRDICRAVDSSASLNVVASAKPGQAQPPNPAFAGWRARLPRRGADHWQGRAAPHPEGITLRLTPLSDEARHTSLSGAAFLPLENGMIDLDTPQVWRQKGGVWEALLPKGVLATKPGADLSGLLLLPASKPDLPPIGWELSLALAEPADTDAHGHDPAMPPQPLNGSPNREKPQ